MSGQQGNQQAGDAAATLHVRLTDAVAHRLGVTVSFLRWQRDPRTGADTPIFVVPADRVQDARALGLTVEGN